MGGNFDVCSVGMTTGDGEGDETTASISLLPHQFTICIFTLQSFLHLSGADGSFVIGLSIKPIDWLE